MNLSGALCNEQSARATRLNFGIEGSAFPRQVTSYNSGLVGLKFLVHLVSLVGQYSGSSGYRGSNKSRAVPFPGR